MDRYDPYTDKFIRDTIDRTDAIDALCKNGLEKERSGQLVIAMCEAKQWAIDTIEQLPSAEPQIIRCKDCKHRDKYGCCTHWKGLAMGDIPIATDDNDFCSRAERREVEDAEAKI